MKVITRGLLRFDNTVVSISRPAFSDLIVSLWRLSCRALGRFSARKSHSEKKRVSARCRLFAGYLRSCSLHSWRCIYVLRCPCVIQHAMQRAVRLAVQFVVRSGYPSELTTAEDGCAPPTAGNPPASEFACSVRPSSKCSELCGSQWNLLYL